MDKALNTSTFPPELSSAPVWPFLQLLALCLLQAVGGSQIEPELSFLRSFCVQIQLLSGYCQLLGETSSPTDGPLVICSVFPTELGAP